jgi:glycosyltransferase involved in cell wall biosynthesis
MPRPIKILHCLGTLDPGGVETWLLHILKAIDTKRFQFDFCTFGPHAGLFAPEVEKFGARVLRCPLSQNLWKFGRCFRGILRQGQYDVVHSHVHLLSGLLLRWAHLEGVQVRVAHSHNSHDGKSKTASRRAYRSLMKRLIRNHATHGLAASCLAAQDVFLDWGKDSRVAILHYGIDLQRFHGSIDSDSWRKKIGLPPGVHVIGHVGNFVPAKNHSFLLDLASRIKKHRPDIHFLLIGDGSLRASVEARTLTMGLQGIMHFLGTRTDVPELLRSCVDAFVFPSLWEGLPIAVLEAQAAGLPCVISDDITGEVAVLPDQIDQLPLALGAEEWATRTIKTINHGKFRAQSSINAMEQTEFCIDRSCGVLTEFYDEASKTIGNSKQAYAATQPSRPQPNS